MVIQSKIEVAEEGEEAKKDCGSGVSKKKSNFAKYFYIDIISYKALRAALRI